MTESTPNKPSEAVQAARLLLRELQGQYPVFRDSLPLAIGIDRQVLSVRPDTERKPLRMALRYHTTSLRYLKGFDQAATRFNLDGSTAEEITSEHRAHAAQMAHERQQREAERRRSHKAAAAAEAAERQRAEKLAQLAAKFAKS